MHTGYSYMMFALNVKNSAFQIRFTKLEKIL